MLTIILQTTAKVGLCESRMTPMDVYKKTSRHFSAGFRATKYSCFLKRLCDISRVCDDQNKYFKPKHDLVLTITKWFLNLNLAIRTAWTQHKFEGRIKRKVTVQHDEM